MRLAAFIVMAFAFVSCSDRKIDTAPEAKAAFEAYVGALNKGDIAVAAAMYDAEEGFHWIERGQVQYESGEEAAASLKSLVANGSAIEMTLGTVRVAELTAGSALVSAQFSFAMSAENGDPQFSFDGWMTVGMVKRTDGWRIAGGQSGPGAQR